MLSRQTLTGVSALSSMSRNHSSLLLFQSPSPHCLRLNQYGPGCSLRVHEISMEEPLESDSQHLRGREEDVMFSSQEDQKFTPPKVDNEEEADDKGISRIQVPRQRHIPVSKAELLDAILVNMFDDSRDEDSQDFVLVSSCLDSILHAEHKSILEEMRTHYFMDNAGLSNGDRDLVAKGKNSESIANGTIAFGGLNNRVAVASRFQRAFMQLLNDAQFEEVSARDLMLTSALNTDYLLNLPIYVDWKRASQSNAIIFRRGYATERQKGLLIVDKLDYIQSKLLQTIFFVMSKPLGRVGKWINEAFIDALQTEATQDWIKRMKPWLKELSVYRQSYFSNEQCFDTPLVKEQFSDRDLPIWLAAQRAVSRYEGILSPTGPRGRLIRKLLTWIGLLPPTPGTPCQLDRDSNASEPYLRPTFLSRITIGDIWKPASRKNCGNDLWKMLKTSVSILLSESILQEPAFKELILLYTNDISERQTNDEAEVPSLQLKIYEKIPVPDLPVIFPHKKLSFRIIDTVRLDVATILGLLAYFINYKFEDILSSPSAIILDVIPITALIIYVTRVALGYKQTWDRYQLLVNKTLYEKTLASGFGSVHFLLDASEQQQYKEAILAYAILLKEENGQIGCPQSLGDKCERFMYDMFKAKVEVPVDKAIDTLVRLGLVAETSIDGRRKLQSIPCRKAYESLRARWNSLLGHL
ncbi:DUF3754 domain-containing protein [Cephalotus follicularis]|uniref:DUF3754 domain-containing protein n=1 Tax=Cephalotus follicularis TaxID=3775 RepID=A0A1Q3CGA4_CEPFO|nr:DUF3754 domain-containing protein [Cephalotus follicularis]